MIIGKKINLRLIKNIQEFEKITNLYNNLFYRQETDHTEIKSFFSELEFFNKTGYWSENKGKLLLVEKNDEILGEISFIKTTEFELEIGYRIYSAKNIAKGYMSEALKLFSVYLFQTKPIRRLKLLIANPNKASLRLAEKCGFKKEGVLREAYYFRNNFCDLIIYGILREECLIEEMKDAEN